MLPLHHGSLVLIGSKILGLNIQGKTRCSVLGPRGPSGPIGSLHGTSVSSAHCHCETTLRIGRVLEWQGCMYCDEYAISLYAIHERLAKITCIMHTCKSFLKNNIPLMEASRTACY